MRISAFAKATSLTRWVLMVGYFMVYHPGFSQSNASGGRQVNIEDNGAALIAKVGGKAVLEYQYKTQLPFGLPTYFKRSGFIHPAFSPSGDTITEGFPEHHTHHHGIFSAWVNTTLKGKKIDFWNQHQGTGTVQFKEILSITCKERYAEFKTKQHHVAFIAGDTIPVLEEIWTITIYNVSVPFVWDIAVKQTNISDATLQIDQYHYGGMAFRARNSWYHNRKSSSDSLRDSFSITTSEGRSRLEANHTRPKWVSMSGKIAGKNRSLTVLPLSPSSEFVRVHPEIPYFCFTPVVKEGFRLEPGESYGMKYRVITSDNIASSEQIEPFVSNTLLKN